MLKRASRDLHNRMRHDAHPVFLSLPIAPRYFDIIARQKKVRSRDHTKKGILFAIACPRGDSGMLLLPSGCLPLDNHFYPAVLLAAGRRAIVSDGTIQAHARDRHP